MAQYKLSLTVVLHDGYGGFSILPEIAEYLRKYKGWKIIPVHGMQIKDEAEPTDIYHSYYDGKPSDSYWCPQQDTIEFRANPDLIEAVRHLKKELERKHDKKQIEWSEYYYSSIRKLKVVDLIAHAEIQEFNDGHERIVLNSSHADSNE